MAQENPSWGEGRIAEVVTQPGSVRRCRPTEGKSIVGLDAQATRSLHVRASTDNTRGTSTNTTQKETGRSAKRGSSLNQTRFPTLEHRTPPVHLLRSSNLHRYKVLVQPVEDLADHALQIVGKVAGLVNHHALVFLRGAPETE